MAYYKLAMISKAENTPFLYVEYLKKAAQHKYKDAIFAIVDEYMDKNPLVTKLPPADIQEWAAYVIKNKPSNSSSLEEGINSLVELLSNERESSFAQNKQYIDALQTIKQNNSSAPLLFQKVIQKRSHPHAHFMLAIYNIVNLKTFKEHIIKSFNCGIIKKPGLPHSIFIDGLLLNSVTCFIKNTIEKPNDNTKKLIAIIVDELTSRNVNIADFKRLLRMAHNVNIDNYYIT